MDAATLELVLGILRFKYKTPILAEPEHLASESLRYKYAIDLGQSLVAADVEQALRLKSGGQS